MTPKEKTDLTAALSEFVIRRATATDSTICTVDSVDLADYTCYCQPIGDFADIQKVKVKLQVDKDGFFVVPKVGSIVIVSFTSDSTGFISMVTEITDLVIFIDNNNKLEVSTSGFIFNDGTLDGMVKVNSLVNKLNNLETLINKFVTNINAWIPSPNDPGAQLLKNQFTLVNPVTPLTPTVKADVENPKIKQ